MCVQQRYASPLHVSLPSRKESTARRSPGRAECCSFGGVLFTGAPPQHNAVIVVACVNASCGFGRAAAYTGY